MMGNSIKSVLIFITGMAVGSAVTYKFVSEKEKARSEADIADMEAYYERIYGNHDEKPVEDTDICEEPDIEKESEEYKEMAKEYTSKSDDIHDDPCVIEPNEFGEIEDYDIIDLTYYADGVIADECDEVVDDVESKIGLNNIDRIGEYEDNVLHIRNDKLETYYEILAVDDKYKEG